MVDDIAQSRTIWPFPGLIFVLLGINVVIVVSSMYLASSDTSVAIEPDYYRKAVNFNQAAQQRDRNLELAWQIDLAPILVGETIVLRLTDRAAQPMEGARVNVVAFHHADANKRLATQLREIEPGMYRSDESLVRSGVWEIRIEAKAGESTFTHTAQLIVRKER